MVALVVSGNRGGSCLRRPAAKRRWRGSGRWVRGCPQDHRERRHQQPHLVQLLPLCCRHVRRRGGCCHVRLGLFQVFRDFREAPWRPPWTLAQPPRIAPGVSRPLDCRWGTGLRWQSWPDPSLEDRLPAWNSKRRGGRTGCLRAKVRAASTDKGERPCRSLGAIPAREAPRDPKRGRQLRSVEVLTPGTARLRSPAPTAIRRCAVRPPPMPHCGLLDLAPAAPSRSPGPLSLVGAT